MRVAVQTRVASPRGLPARLRHASFGRGMGQTSCSPCVCGQTGFPATTIDGETQGAAPWVNLGTSSSVGQATSTAPTSSNQCTAGSGATASNASKDVGSIIATVSGAIAPVAPFVALAGEIAGALTGMLNIGEGCGASCIDATEVANYAECIMAVNLNTYMNQPAPRLASAQSAALSVFQQAWNYLQQGCGAVTGSAGDNCISQRQPGGKYDLWQWAYYPIANDPCVQADPAPVNALTGASTTVDDAVTSAAAAVDSLFAGITGGSISPVLLIGGLALLVVALGGGL